jgi:hypothetical protein
LVALVLPRLVWTQGSEQPLVVWAALVLLALLALVAEVDCSVGCLVVVRPLVPLVPPLPLQLLELVAQPPLPPQQAGSSPALTSATSPRLPWLCLVKRRRT